MKNPDWIRDEVILALDLYFKDKTAVGNDRHPEVIALSKFLNKLPLFPLELRTAKFRNPNGVGMKLANFQRFDPDYTGSGLVRGSHIEKEVWEDFYSDRQRLKKTVKAIHGVYATPNLPAEIQMEFDEDQEAPEGRILTAVHRIRERSKALTKKKKAQAIAKTGKLECEACGFDFCITYGDAGSGFIECHHDIPVSSLNENSTTKLKDLRLVCSNCHRIIHKSKPWLSIETIRNIVNQNAKVSLQ
jgi:5-methylcytosine-specific restriction protein A